MNKTIPIVLFSILSLNAQIIDAIAIDVDGEPITTLEIQAVQTKLNMSKKAAIEALIKDRLAKSAVEKAGIEVTPAEVDARIEQIALSKGLTATIMRSEFEKRGVNWDAYREQIEFDMKKMKFFEKSIANSIPTPTDEDLELYYKTNIDKFMKVSSVTQISLIAYSSNSSSKLKEAIGNPMKIVDGVTRKSMLVSSSEVNPQLFNLLNSTPEGGFTKPINTGTGFVSYFIKSKSKQDARSFRAIKNIVTMAWLQEERDKASKNFINRLKENANIRVIRL